MSHHGNDSGYIPKEFQTDMKKRNDEFVNRLNNIDRNLGDKIKKQWPEGIIRPDDDGETTFAVGSEAGKVILQFPEPTKWIGFTPDQAMEIAQCLIKHAKHTGLTKPFALEL